MADSIYTRLPLNKSTEIRLLTLLPADNRDDPIKCLISRADLDAAPEYKAVSYCWGKRDNPVAITVGDTSLEVTQNLATALGFIRGSWAPATLWVDAVCINQDDDREKETQIPLMGRVYSSAEATICWVATDPTPDKICSVGANLAFLSNPEAIPLEVRKMMLSVEPRSAPEVGQTDINEVLAQCTEAMVPLVLLKLEGSDYWNRTWIVQEILLSKRVILQGILPGPGMRGCLSWDVLESHIHQNRNSDPGHLSFDHISMTIMVEDKPFQITSAPPRKIKRLVEMRDAWQSGTPQSRDMMSIMITNVQKASTDPRDKIWGFFGIAEDAQQLTTVDLTLSTADLYAKWAYASIAVHKSLRVLQHAGVGQSPRPAHMKRAHNAPSWVPQWDLADRDNTAAGSYHYSPSLDHHGVLFCASGTHEPEVSFSVDRVILNAKGVLVDTVSRIKDYRREKSKDGTYQSTTSSCLAWLLDTLGLDAFRLPSNTETRETVFESFFRTLMTDRMPCLKRRLQHGAEYYYLLMSFVTGVITGSPDDRFGNVRATEDGTCFITRKADQEELVVIEGDSYTMEDQMLIYARSFTAGTDRVALFGTVTGYFMHGRVLFLTKGGLMGLGPAGMVATDRICALYGCNVPLVLREDEGHWLLVGECYVHGIMDGLAMEMLAGGELEESVFEIW